MPKEDAFYGQVSEEISAGQIDKALWTKAFAHAEGDINKARAFYLRYRATQLLESNANRPENFLPEGLSFTTSSVNYQGKEILHSQIIGVVFYSVSSSINGIPSNDSHTIRLRSATWSIELRSTKFFKIGNGKRKKEFDAVYAFASHYIFPLLVQKFVQPVVDKDQTHYIGSIGVTPIGLTRQGFFGSHKTLPWSRYYNYGLHSGRRKFTKNSIPARSFPLGDLSHSKKRTPFCCR